MVGHRTTCRLSRFRPASRRSVRSFSLAVIAYELLTGEKPFAADSIAALAYKIVREPAVPTTG